MRTVEINGPLRGISNSAKEEVKRLIAMDNYSALFASVVSPFRRWCHHLFKLVVFLTPSIKALRAIPVV